VLEVRRAADRFCTRTDWLTSWHSFSYGPWYDQDNVAFGPLTVLNHDVLAPGAGFDEHRHIGVDLVTYVVAGALLHRDSTGHEAVVRAGEVQVLRSGSGVTHTEGNASAAEPVEYVQMWLRSTNKRVSYGAPTVGGDPPSGLLVALRGAVLRLLSVRARNERHGVGGELVHTYVLSGEVVIGDTRLGPGDSARATSTQVTFAGTGAPAEVLVWQLRDEPQNIAVG
jgi:redox-sensitive bicupin YhaK (pirin superfamily)